MQPPRTRTPRIELGDTETLRMIILNATALAVTLMTLRFASSLVGEVDQHTIPHYIQMITEPIVWPFQFVPILSSTLVGEATVIDALMIPAIGFTGLLIAGILAGWRDSQSRPGRYEAPDR